MKNYKLLSSLLIPLVLSFNLLAQDFKPAYSTEVYKKNEQNNLQFPGVKNQVAGNVELHTGRANINIPIHTVKSYDLQVPLQMNYISGGVKIDQVSNWIGIDWNFQPGGIISRELKGAPDEEGYFTGRTDSSKHTQPDIFHFSLSQYSGTFMFDSEKRIHLFPYQNILVNCTFDQNSSISSFEIITPEGVVYTFGGESIEQTTLNTESYVIRPHDGIWKDVEDVKHESISFNSSWYLTEITSPSGDYIHFNYSDIVNLSYVSAPIISLMEFEGNMAYDDSENPIFNRKRNRQYVLTPEGGSTNSLYEKDGLPYDYARHYSFTQNRFEIKKKNLHEIISKSGEKVQFITDNNRFDLPNAHKLNEIKIIKNDVLVKTYRLAHKNIKSIYCDETGTYPDPLNFNEFALFKDVTFSGDYPTGIPANVLLENSDKLEVPFLMEYDNYMLEGLKEYNYYRLFLTGVFEIAPSGKVKNNFSFEYINPEQLQRRTSTYVDFYGYNIDKPMKHLSEGVQVVYGFNYNDEQDYTRMNLDTKSTNGMIETVKNMLGSTSTFYYYNNKNTAGSRVFKIEKSDGKKILTEYFDYFDKTEAQLNYKNSRFYYDEYETKYNQTTLDFIYANRYTLNIYSSQNFSNQSSLTNGSPIVYNVVETYNDIDRVNGYSIYTFYEPKNVNASISTISYPIFKLNDWDFGYCNGKYHNWQKIDYNWSSNNDTYIDPNRKKNTYVNQSYKYGLIKDQIFMEYDDDANRENDTIKRISYYYDFDIVPNADSNYQVVSETINKYNFVTQWWEKWVGGGHQHDWKRAAREAQIKRTYTKVPELFLLKSKEERTFDGEYPGDITKASTITDYYNYDIVNLYGAEQYVLRSVERDLGYKKVKEKYKYPIDYNFTASGNGQDEETKAMAMLRYKHIMTPILEKINYITEKDNIEKVIGGQINTFKIDSFAKPYQQFVLNIDKSITDYTESNITEIDNNSFSKDSRYELVSTNEYDENNRLIQVIPKYGLSTAKYYNNYNNNVAIAKNANHDEIFIDNYEAPVEDRSTTDSYSGEYGFVIGTNEFSSIMVKNWGVEKSGKFVSKVWIKTDKDFTGASKLVYEIRDASSGEYVSESGYITRSISGTNGEWQRMEHILDFDNIKQLNPEVQEFVIKSYLWNYDGVSEVVVDDFVFYPVDAKISFTSIDVEGKLLASFDHKDEYNHKEYDKLGRLSISLDKDKNVVSDLEYNFKEAYVFTEENEYIFDPLYNFTKNYKVLKGNITDISLSKNEDWISIDNISESDEYIEFSLTVEINTTNLRRSSEITITGLDAKGQSISKKFEIWQEGNGLSCVTRSSVQIANHTSKVNASISNTINYDWGEGSPSGFDGDYFNMKWEGYLIPPCTGNYKFYLLVDDEGVLTVGGDKIIDNTGLGWSEYSSYKELEAGKKYPISLLFYEILGNAKVQLSWSLEGMINKEIIPAKYFILH